MIEASAFGVERPAAERQWPVLFALGFRPFFLGAALAAIALVAVWVVSYSGTGSIATSFDPVSWHGHEMVFGYASAVIAGFLLTAVRNWTGMRTLEGPALLALSGLWLAARCLLFLPDLIPALVVAVVDLAFLPLLIVALAVPLVRSGQVHNLVFLPVLGILGTANLLVHLEVLEVTTGTARIGLYIGVHLILLIISIMGGRVIPFFTERALPGARVRRWTWVESSSFATVLALAVSEVFHPSPVLIGTIAIAGAAIHGVRLSGWYDRRIWRFPLLWVLFTGYAWIVAGFALRAAAASGWLLPQLALHAFTAGAIGTLTLGMMARVALGHTGRPLQPTRAVALAFALINCAAVLRVLAPVLALDWYIALVSAAGTAWVAAFSMFAAVYTPILIRPRADGRPG